MVSFYKPVFQIKTPVFQLKTPGYLQGFTAIRFASCPTVYSFSRPFYLIFFCQTIKGPCGYNFWRIIARKKAEKTLLSMA